MQRVGDRGDGNPAPDPNSIGSRESGVFLTCCDVCTPMSPQVARRALKFCSLIASAARCECLLPPDQVDFVSDANLAFSTRSFEGHAASGRQGGRKPCS